MKKNTTWHIEQEEIEEAIIHWMTAHGIPATPENLVLRVSGHDERWGASVQQIEDVDVPAST